MIYRHMKNINQIYNIDSGTGEEYIDKRALKSSLFSQKLELFRKSLRNEKAFLPFCLRRINLLWETILAVIVIITVAATTISTVLTKTEEEPVIIETSASIKINDVFIDSKGETLTIDDRTYIKLPLICDNLGFAYEKTGEDGIAIHIENKEYRFSSASKSVDVFMEGSDNAASNIKLSQNILVKDSSFYIYVRDMSLFMPVTTIWDENTKTVTIRSIS